MAAETLLSHEASDGEDDVTPGDGEEEGGAKVEPPERMANRLKALEMGLTDQIARSTTGIVLCVLLLVGEVQDWTSWLTPCLELAVCCWCRQTTAGSTCCS